MTLGNQSKSVAADSAGKWSLKLDPVKASGPLTLKVQGQEHAPV